MYQTIFTPHCSPFLYQFPSYNTLLILFLPQKYLQSKKKLVLAYLPSATPPMLLRPLTLLALTAQFYLFLHRLLCKFTVYIYPFYAVNNLSTLFEIPTGIRIGISLYPYNK